MITMNMCLNKFHLSLIDSSVMLCERCSTILFRENMRYHLLKQHGESMNKHEIALLMQLTVNQATSSCYIKMAKGTSEVGINVAKFPKINQLPSMYGYRCTSCNYAEQDLLKLCSRHEKFHGSRCRGNRECYEESHIQIVRIGSKFVGFGVDDEFVPMSDGGLLLTETEYRNARQAMTSFERGRTNGIDIVESQLYRSLGWFRKNVEGSDFIDISIYVLQQVNQFNFHEAVSARLLNFFKGRILAVAQCPADIRLLLSDDKCMTIRPIIDKHHSYAKCFVDVFKIVTAVVTFELTSLVPESVFFRLVQYVRALLQIDRD